MLHTIAHIASGCAYALSLISSIVLLYMLGVVSSDKRLGKFSELIWEVPAVFAGLVVFWAVVGYWLRLP
jgi:hypothetical protein